MWEEFGDRCREFKPLKTKRGSIFSRLFGCGGLLLAAYGSFASPAGVNGLLYAAAAAALVGLDSRDTGPDAPLGPIEKAALCDFEAAALESLWLVGLEDKWPGVSGRDDERSVVELGGAVSAMSGPASESASTFRKGAPFIAPSAGVSRDPDAKGVRGGVPIPDGLGLARGDGCVEES